MYDRKAAVSYARRWALKRNPAYLDFQGIGGDCTNFVSQCLYAGSGVMNFTPAFGWYYRSAADRAPAWTSVEYLYRFLTENQGAGPYAAVVRSSEVCPGDVVQLANPGERYTHAALVIEVSGGELYVASHSFDAWRKPLSAYRQPVRRFLHIVDVHPHA